MHNPDLYQDSNVIQKRDAKICLEKHLWKMKRKNNNNRILDIGCGDGSVTNIIKQFYSTDFKMVGCDISEKMIKFASDHHTDEQTSFIVLDIASDLPEKIIKGFDSAFSFYALNWVKDQKRAFENIFNLLQSDGECFLVFAAYHAFYDVYRTLSRNVKWSLWVNDVEKYISPYHDSKEPDKEIKKLMQSVGFVDINVENEDMLFVYNHSEKKLLGKLILAVNPFEITEDKQDDFVEDHIRILMDIAIKHKVTDSNNLNDFPVCYKTMIAYGRKP